MNVSARRAHYSAERDEFWMYAGTLSDDELDEPSLCAGWTVRDVIAHVGAWERMLGFDAPLELVARAGGLAWLYLRARGATDRVNELLHGQPAPAGPPPPFGRHLFDRLAPGSQLAELVVHHQDIRRPLGRHRSIPHERLLAALEGLPRLAGVDLRRRTAGRRWETTDLDWSLGRGPRRVRGRAEAVLLALAGRAIAEDELVLEPHEPAS